VDDSDICPENLPGEKDGIGVLDELEAIDDEKGVI
jgi:hypothetical protein